MRTKGFTWYWPLSFLAALGQLLLLLTQNDGGPATGRLLLAFWVFSIPGFWLANLLIKPGLRLPEGLPLRFSLALAVSYLALLLGSLFSSGGSTHAIVALSLGISLVYTFRSGRHPKGPRLSESDRALGQGVALVALILFGVYLLTDGSLALPELPGDAGALYHPWLNMMAHMSAQPLATVIAFLPTVMAPLGFLSLCLVGWVILDRRFLGFLAGLLGLLLLMNGEGLRWAGHIDRMTLIPFWSAVALLLDGFEDSHPPQIPAWALVVLAAVATHMGFLLSLGIVLMLLGIRTMTSFRRFQEGIPFFVAYVVPAGLLVLMYCAQRHWDMGSVALTHLPGQEFRELGSGDRILNPDLFPWGTYWGGALCLLFLPVLFRQSLDQPKLFYLVSTILVLAILGYTPMGFAFIDSLWESHVRVFSWINPIPVSLVALGAWAIVGLQRSLGLV